MRIPNRLWLTDGIGLFCLILATAPAALPGSALAQGFIATVPTPVTVTTYAGTLAAANTFQVVLAAVNADVNGIAHLSRIGDGVARRNCRIWNPSPTATLGVYFGQPSLAVTPAIQIPPVSSVSCFDSGFVIQDAISLTGPAGSVYTITVFY